MPAIGKIRRYSGLLVVVIGIALAAFVLGDLFKNTGRRKAPPVAVINGEEIASNEFRQDVDEMKKPLQQQSKNENLSEQQRYQAMQMAWNDLLMEEIMREKYKNLGLAVKHDPNRKPSISREELMDMLTGDNPHKLVVKTFKDPKTGKFNPSLVSNFLSTLDQRNAKTKRQWYQLEQAIKKDRLQTKYYNLFKKGYYIPGPMARQFHEQNARTARIELMGLRYRSIPDSVITITDEDYKSYYQDHKQEFEKEKPSTKLKYVIFDVNPSRRDFRKARKKTFEYFKELKNADEEDVPTIVGTIRENSYDSIYHKKGELPPRLDTALFNAEPGTMVRPYQEGEKFHMARLMDVATRPDSMQASHILIKHNRSSKAQGIKRTPKRAQEMADSLYNVVQDNPEKFKQLASSVSDAPAADKQGDLGWFKDGDMLPTFNEGVINHEIGDIFQVQTRFGYHIVKVTGKKHPVQKISVAQIEVLIDATEETRDSVWTNASRFAGNNRSAKAFDQAVRAQNMEPREKVVTPMESNIPGIQSPREIIQWAFDEKTKVGSVSEKVFEVGDKSNKYVVALLEERTQEGIMPLEKIKSDIQEQVGREVRARVLKKRIRKKMSNAADIYQLASSLNTEVDTLPHLSFSTYSIPEYGPEPRLVGKIMSSPEGKLKGPVKGKMGVYAFLVDKFSPAPKTDNFARIRQKKQNRFNTRVSGRNGMGRLFQAMKDKAEIEDNRIRYY